ncbi:MAG: peptidylprolyl isomerase [Sulfuritalea sp.]|nr:peptidylprolyl isomerase [Sulfuritalea sp.]
MRLPSVIVILALLAAPVAAQPRQPIAVDRVVAVVNDEAITLNELRERYATVTRQLQARGTPLPPRAVLEQQLLERLVIDRLQMQLARDTGLRIADAELDAALRRIAENNRLSLAEFRAALERDGIAWAAFRADIRTEMTLARLREREVENRIVVSDAEIDNYLADPGQSDQAAVVTLGHIVIRVPEQVDATRLAQLRARAEEALAQIGAGRDFGQVAASFSEVPDALAGGIMAPRPADRLPQIYAEAVAGLQPGAVSAILRSPAGFHIVKLIERQGGRVDGVLMRQTRARHILIRPSELVSDEEARHKLAGLKERLDHGADFAELARVHSNDLTAAKGGDLGWLYPGDTAPDFERAMDALQPGEIGAPVRSPFGWHLIQVLERKNAEAGAERKRLLARQALRERKSDEAYEDWLRQLRDRAYVEYRLEEH